MAAADVGDLGPGLQFVDHAGQARQPFGHQMGAVTRAEEALGAAEHARVMIAPGQGTIAAHGGNQFVFVVKQRGNHRGTASDIHR
ncbi:hypothetical protein D3C84_993240 [compost metagenome]